MRTWIIALAALLVLPAVGAAATIAVPPVEEQLVEGHTVFTVIEVRNETNVSAEEFHAAVAVLVREVKQEVDAFRFPGVLWFNDQYLINPESSLNRVREARYPCTGAVIATSAAYGGDARVDAAGLNPASVPLGGNYVESYFITDPNDHSWNVDKWLTASGFLWTVAIMDNQAGYGVPDDGVCEGSVWADLPSNTAGLRYRDPGDQQPDPMGYPCGLHNGDANCPNIQYNALLYFRIQDLQSAGASKDHEETDLSSDYHSDVSGCHEHRYRYNTTASPDVRWWNCPDDDDNREGNSHPYNPETPWPLAAYDGRYNHGGSGGDCDGDGIVDQPTEDIDSTQRRSDYNGDYLCHATRDILVYFHYATAPLLRDYYVFDVPGSSAPYHCHDDMIVCGPGSIATP